MPFCTQCGHQNPDGARFCSQCGTRLEAGDAAPTQTADPGATATDAPSDSSATMTFGTLGQSGASSAPAAPAPTEPGAEAEHGLEADQAAAVDALPQGSALLVVQRGPGAGNRFLLDQDVVTAGRHPESEIFLDDITVSRRHVEFRRTPEGYSVSDVGSLNGTYVNRDRIDSSTLQNGDEVQIGKFRLVYFTGDEPAA